MTRSPKRILVATDLSPESDEALMDAIALAREAGAALEILYVLELEVEQYPLGFAFAGDHAGLMTYVERELARRAELASQAGVSCSVKALEGNAATDIVDYGDEVGADLIVVGTHGRKGLIHALLGSVAEKVVQRAKCPVLTIPISKKAA
jgi:nucleotide-binding universal stress UspA family protein